MNKKIVKPLRYLLWIVVAALLLYYSFKGVNWKDFGDALSACRWEWVIVSMVIGGLVLLVRGLRWQMLLRPIDPSTRVSTCFNAMNICMLVNLVLPRVGEVVRCGVVTKNASRDADGRKRASLDRVFGTVVVDRAWDMLSVLVIMVLVLVFLRDRFGSFFTDTVLPGIGGAAALWWIAALLVAAGATFIFLCYRLKDRGRIWGRVWNVIKGLGDGLRSCLHMKNVWLFILYTVLIWVGYWLMSATVMWALAGIDPAAVGPELGASVEKIRSLGMVDALFLMFVGAVSTIIPVPGGFGAFHTVVAGAMTSIYGLPFGIGLIFATLSHESQVITDALLGLVSYGCESFRK